MHAGMTAGTTVAARSTDLPVAAIPEIDELNIGHAIVARVVMVGMERAVREMLDAMRLGRRA